ncbi:MAG TPA: AraC family transcriptional regulator [Armatimonadota bacterium]|jgi:AraC-like DNA-binding protein
MTSAPIVRLSRARIFHQSQISLDLVRSQHPTPEGCALHTHEFSELVIVLKGRGEHVTPRGCHATRAGDVFVLHGDEAHGYRDTRDLELANVLFSMAELDLPWKQVSALPGFHVLFTLEPRYRERDRFESRLRLTPDKLWHITGLLDGLEGEIQRRTPGWEAAALAYFLLIVTDLCRHYSQVSDPHVQSLLRIGRVISHLEQHYTERLTLEELAEVGCMSTRTLCRTFRDAFGCPPIDYLTRLRVSHAMELLQARGSSVTDVAMTVGFGDSSYFARQFRRVTGTSPQRYRTDPAAAVPSLPPRSAARA